VGKVEVIPTDTIPANAGRVQIEVANVAKYFYLRTANGYFSVPNLQDGTGNEVNVISIRPEDIGKKETVFGSYFMLKDKVGTTAAPRAVTITAFDKQN